MLCLFQAKQASDNLRMLTAMKKTPAAPEPEIRPIAEDARYNEAIEKLAALEARLEQTRARRRRAQARNRGEKTQRSVIDRASDLLSGGRVPAGNAVAEMEACDIEEFEVLRPAIAAQTAVVDEIRGDLDLVACNAMRAQNDAALRALLTAVENAYAAIAASAAIGNLLRSKGYRPLADVLPAIYPPAIVALGDPDNVGRSQAALFKETLRKHGIIR